MRPSHVAGLLLLALLAGLVSACTSSAPVHDRVVSVQVPLPQPCVAWDRPAAVPVLKDRVAEAQWALLDVRQKAAQVARQELLLRGYAERLEAATAGCP